MRPASGISSPSQCLRVAAAVPVLVVGQRDRARELHQLGARPGEDAGADRGVRLHRGPLVWVERTWLGEDVVGDADLADVVERARVAQQLGLRRRHAHRERQTLAEAADALDVEAGLGVAPLDRHAQPLQYLDLGVAQLLRPLPHARLEQLVVARDGAPGAALGELAPRDRPDGADHQRRQRRDDGDDQPGVEGELRADCEEQPRRPAQPARRPRREGAAPAGERSAPSAPTSSRFTPRGAERRGAPCMAVQIALACTSAPAISAAAADRRRMHVAQRRCRRAHDDDRDRGTCRARSDRARRRRTRRSAPCQAVRDSRSRLLPSSKALRGTGVPARSAVDRRHRLEAVHLAREARDDAGAVVVQVGRAGPRVDPAQVRVAAEHVACARVRRSRSSPARRRRPRPIASNSARSSRGARGLGELHVVDDLARARGVEAAHDPSVQRAPERPLLAQRAERLGVDRDDDHVVGPLGPADGRSAPRASRARARPARRSARPWRPPANATIATHRERACTLGKGQPWAPDAGHGGR